MKDQLIGPGDNDYGRKPAPVGFSRDTIPRVLAAIEKNPPPLPGPHQNAAEEAAQAILVKLYEALKGPNPDATVREILKVEAEPLLEQEFFARAAKMAPLEVRIASALKYHTFTQLTPERIEKMVNELLPIVSQFLFGPIK